MNDPIEQGNWKDIVKDMSKAEFWRNPDGFLSERNIKVDDSLQSQVDRLKNFEQGEYKAEMWHALQALAEGQLSPEERRDLICKLAETYQRFIGWEGDSNDEPGW